MVKLCNPTLPAWPDGKDCLRTVAIRHESVARSGTDLSVESCAAVGATTGRTIRAQTLILNRFDVMAGVRMHLASGVPFISRLICLYTKERMGQTKTMKAAVVRAFGKPLVIEELPVPEPKSNEILVKMESTGVCHTDLHAVEGDWPIKPCPPFIPGHEGVGYVAAAGREVKHVKEGDLVGTPWLYSACGECEHCLAGWETLCERQLNGGYSVNGSFSEYAIADPNYVAHVPKGLDLIAIAPVLCAGVTVYKGLKMTDTKPGNWVVISGVGGLGHRGAICQGDGIERGRRGCG